MTDFRQLAQDIGSAPLGDLIAAIGQGVAEAQTALDAGSLEQTLALYSESDELARQMRELGYRPTFYAIPETEGELKLSLTVAGRAPIDDSTTAATTTPIPSTATIGALRRLDARPRVYAAPVDGRYQNSYSFSSEVTATVRFKVVAVPPPSEAESARIVPNLVGTTFKQAASLAESFDLVLDTGTTTDPAADATLTSQDPAPGEVVVVGSTISVDVA